MSYTALSVLGVVFAVAVDLALLRTRLLRRRAFWVAYAIVFCFQLLVNGVLTGLPIVRYDAGRIVGWRIAYAPVEDLLFGFALVTVTLATWVWLGRRELRAEPAANPAPPERRPGADGAAPR
jgi:lycopene cyclase domain-containing protein